ncbi:MAG: energy-coupling factor ABC transporter substrate-binding protein [Planctomycetaceae bacterium]|jgi:cobalt/nickel transport protein|nr:energy-coupling factor ABC transporter substrate-binding protein [Planctomycetaceae bacterium]
MHLNWKYNIVLLFIATLIAVLPLLFVKNSEFTGTDSKAAEEVQKISNDFEPWFQPFWEPPGGEIESLLFALQASLGTGIIFYCIGYLKGKRDAGKIMDH